MTARAPPSTCCTTPGCSPRSPGRTQPRWSTTTGPGPGRWITVYANPEHMWLTVAGLVLDTAWYSPVAPTTPDQRAAVAARHRHPSSRSRATPRPATPRSPSPTPQGSDLCADSPLSSLCSRPPRRSRAAGSPTPTAATTQTPRPTTHAAAPAPTESRAVTEPRAAEVAALRRYTRLSINWSSHTLARQQRELARLASPARERRRCRPPRATAPAQPFSEAGSPTAGRSPRSPPARDPATGGGSSPPKSRRPAPATTRVNPRRHTSTPPASPTPLTGGRSAHGHHSRTGPVASPPPACRTPGRVSLRVAIARSRSPCITLPRPGAGAIDHRWVGHPAAPGIRPTVRRWIASVLIPTRVRAALPILLTAGGFRGGPVAAGLADRLDGVVAANACTGRSGARALASPDPRPTCPTSASNDAAVGAAAGAWAHARTARRRPRARRSAPQHGSGRLRPARDRGQRRGAAHPPRASPPRSLISRPIVDSLRRPRAALSFTAAVRVGRHHSGEALSTGAPGAGPPALLHGSPEIVRRAGPIASRSLALPSPRWRSVPLADPAPSGLCQPPRIPPRRNPWT